MGFTAKEALETIGRFDLSSLNEELSQAINYCKSSLKREIPLSVRKKGKDYLCPECGCLIPGTYMRSAAVPCCYNCFQFLDFNEFKD